MFIAVHKPSSFAKELGPRHLADPKPLVCHGNQLYALCTKMIKYSTSPIDLARWTRVHGSQGTQLSSSKYCFISFSHDMQSCILCILEEKVSQRKPEYKFSSLTCYCFRLLIKKLFGAVYPFSDYSNF